MYATHLNISFSMLSGGRPAALCSAIIRGIIILCSNAKRIVFFSIFFLPGALFAQKLIVCVCVFNNKEEPQQNAIKLLLPGEKFHCGELIVKKKTSG